MGEDLGSVGVDPMGVPEDSGEHSEEWPVCWQGGGAASFCYRNEEEGDYREAKDKQENLKDGHWRRVIE